MSPAETRPLASLTISSVAGPTVPSSARAKDALGARARVRRTNVVPGIGCSSSRTLRYASFRSVMTSTKASVLAACTRLSRAAPSTSTMPATCCTVAGTSFIRAFVSPTTTTGRSVTSTLPAAPVMLPRCGSSVAVLSTGSPVRSGCTTFTENRGAHVLPALASGRVVS